MTTTTYQVAGMTCSHCVHAVSEELGAIEGVTAVDVVLNSEGASDVTVTSDWPLELEDVTEALAEAGYALAPRGSLL